MATVAVFLAFVAGLAGVLAFGSVGWISNWLKNAFKSVIQ